MAHAHALHVILKAPMALEHHFMISMIGQVRGERVGGVLANPRQRKIRSSRHEGDGDRRADGQAVPKKARHKSGFARVTAFESTSEQNRGWWRRRKKAAPVNRPI